MRHNGYEYRYQAARGLERRQLYSRYWQSVDGHALEQMTAEELRACADTMDEAERAEREGDTNE